jgi:hypothetical protein
MARFTSLVLLFAVSVATFLLCSRDAIGEDRIKILDGGTVEGWIISEDENYILIRRKSGDIQQIKCNMIERVERGPAFNEEFQKRWGSLPGNDANTAFELGLWCEDRGHPQEAQKCFEKTVSIDPDHCMAREKLGHFFYDGKWYTNAEDYYKARGFVKFKGGWIPKEDKEKIEQGLVKLPDGSWVPRDSLKEREGEPSSASAPSQSTVKKPAAEKKVWKRQVRDDAFYEDFSGSVPWEQRHKLETKHYILETNVSMAHAKRYADMLDKIYERYCKVFGDPPSPRKCLIWIHKDQQEFMAMHRTGAGGFYGGGRVVTYHGKFGPTGCTQTVLFHECTHQFHDMVAGIRRVPIWFAEGLASFFECSEIDEKGIIHIGVVNADRLGIVQQGVKTGNMIHLSQLIATPQSRFSGAHYAYAWTLIYFLVYTGKQNRAVFDKYWSEVACGSSDDSRSTRFLEVIGIPIDKLEECWKEWVLVLESKDLPEDVEAKSKKFFEEWKQKKEETPQPNKK